MLDFTRKSRIVAATPIEVQGRRLLPSVMVTTVSLEETEESATRCAGVRMRPVSVVEQGAAGTFWHPIPNTEMDIMNSMAAVGVGAALLSVVAMLIMYYMRE
jgi:hypothetical protein